MDAFQNGRDWKWFVDRRAFLVAAAVTVSGCGPIIRGQSPDLDPVATDDDDPNRSRFVGEIA